jgi:hypothetical protein
MATAQVCHPDNVTKELRMDLWLMVRWAHTQERFGSMSAAEIAEQLVAEKLA